MPSKKWIWSGIPLMLISFYSLLSINIYFRSVKYMLILFLSIYGGCLKAQSHIEPPLPPIPTRENTDEACYYNGKLSVKERRIKYPFNMADTIKIISFDSYDEKAPIENDAINYSKVFENIILSAVQIDSLTSILFNYGYSPKNNLRTESEQGCYEPRQAILFMNKAGKVNAYIEICFECQNVKSNLPHGSYGVFCIGKYELIQNFFMSLGIKHFTDSKGKIVPTIIEPAEH